MNNVIDILMKYIKYTSTYIFEVLFCSEYSRRMFYACQKLSVYVFTQRIAKLNAAYRKEAHRVHCRMADIANTMCVSGFAIDVYITYILTTQYILVV